MYDFIDYKTETYNAAGGSQCVDIFKLEYLSNPQILHSNYKNYVISITGDNTGNLDKIGLINYDDFEKIRAGEDLGRDFDSFENLYFEDDVDFNFFTFEEDSTPPNQIYAIFLVPSIKVESLTASNENS